MLDGVPMTLGWDHRTDPSLIPITGAQSLVIVRGLGTLLNGPNTLGGTIEVSHDAAAADALGTRLFAGGGFDENSAVVTSLGGLSRLSAGTGAVTLQGGFAYRKSDGFSLPDGATDPSAADGLRTNSDLRHTDGFGSVRWTGRSGATIGATVSALAAERGVPPEEHIAAPRLWRYPYNRRTVAAVSARSSTFRTPFGQATIDVGGGYNGGKVKIQAYSDRTYETETTTELGDEKTLTGRARLTHSLGSATLRAAVTAADVKYTETVGTDPAADYRQKLWSAGAEVEIPIGGRTIVGGGLVYDRTTTPETGGRTPGQEPLDNVGWRAGATHDLGSGVRLHGSASQRSRFPALRELYSGALNRFMPNPDLEPETLLGFEAGVTLEKSLSGSASTSLQVTGFRHRLEDAVIRMTLPAPDRRFRRVNRDRINSHGVEVLTGVFFGSNRERAVSITGDATIQSIAIVDKTATTEPERHAENNPERRGSLELGLPLPFDVRAAASARYTGTQYCLNADTGNEMQLDSQVQSDVALERNFRLADRGVFRALRALVSLDNVSDATVYDQCGLPQPGRTLRLMFTLR
jgi:iron complex outermembrane receptor protein